MPRMSGYPCNGTVKAEGEIIREVTGKAVSNEKLGKETKNGKNRDSRYRKTPCSGEKTDCRGKKQLKVRKKKGTRFLMS